ncbi:MAG: ATP-binding protein [Anaerolineales bacterium]
MRNIFSSRLVRELSLVLLAISGLLFLLGIVLPTWLQRNETRTYALIAQHQAEDLAAQVGEIWPGPSGDIVGLEQVLSSHSRALGVRLAVFAQQGAFLAGSEPDGSLDRAAVPGAEVQDASQGLPAYATRPDPADASLWLYLAVPFQALDGSGWVLRVGLRLASLQSNAQTERSILWWSAAALLLLGGAVLVQVGREQVGASQRLVEAVERIRAGDWSARGLPAEKGDLGDLSRSLALLARELKEKLEELEPEPALLRTVLERMSDGAVILDPGGQIRLANPAAAAMFDLRGQRIEGLSLMQALRRHEVYELWQKARDSGEQQACALEIPGQQRFLEAVATPLGPRLPGSVLLLFQDLTRLRQLETIRRDFVSNISHELRTPLASLKAMVETLRSGAFEDPSASGRFLAHIEREIDVLIQIVEELLELSRIESGQVPLRLETVSPLELVGAAVGRLQFQAERARLMIQVDPDPDLPNVLADPPRVEQVLVNLLHNAIKFTPPDGRIGIQAQVEGEFVRFEVADTGVGIAEENLPRVFERFYKGDRARSGGGTGLGLSIAKHLVEAHGGRIWATSTEGEGSRFFFTLRKAP